MKIMNKAQKMNNNRIRLKSEHGYEVHVQAEQVADNTLIFIAIVSNDFPTHHMPATFCDEFKNTFFANVRREDVGGSKGSISGKASSVLDSIHAKYNTSSIRAVNAKVDQVKDVMRANLDMALSNVEKLDEIDQKAADIDASARTFAAKSSKLRCRMCAENAKSIILIVLIILAVIAIIVGIIVAKTK